MKGARVYLDFNASAPLLPQARAAMIEALDLTANPSSVHQEGRRARAMIEDARRQVAALCGASPDGVVFTSGASEATALALTPYWRLGRSPVRYAKLYTTTTDHSVVIGGGRFAADDIEQVPVDRDGVVDLEALADLLHAHDDTAGLPLVAVHLANNETGVVQPASRIAALVHDAGGILVLDAVQAGGRISLDMTGLGADFLILAAHKIGGPKGAGALVGTADLLMPAPLATGGGQERGFRAGTENYAAISAFGAAARIAAEHLGSAERVRAMRDRFEQAVLDAAPDATIFARNADRLCNTLFFTVPGLKAETAQIAFDLAGVALSSGSACSSGKVGASRVLKAMGYGDEVSGLRVSIGHETGEHELQAFGTALGSLLARRRAIAPEKV